jgi:hypothetical protein
MMAIQLIICGQFVNNMGKTIEKLIDTFNGGIALDQRDKNSNKFALTKHFDATTFKHKLVPHYGTEEFTISETEEIQASYKLIKFLYAPATARGAGLYRLFGFGVDPDSELGAIYEYDIDTNFTQTTFIGASSDSAKYKSDAGARFEDVFFYYKNFIYFWAGTVIKAYDTTGSADLNESFYDASSLDSVAQPVHHPTDDNAYFFHDNFVSRLDDTSWSAKVLTLPAESRIMCAVPYGNYLAIATINKNPDSVTGADFQSIVYLWDRDSSLETLSERIDFGSGKIIHLANLDNKLMAIVDNYADGKFGFNKGKILVKQAFGQTSKIVNELEVDARIDRNNTGWEYIPRTNFLFENKLYFPMRADLDNDERNGVWELTSDGRLTLDTLEEDLGTDGFFKGIFKTGNMWWLAINSAGLVKRTNSDASYSTVLESIYDSRIFNIKDSQKIKKLIGTSVMTEPLPTAGQVVLQYQKNEEIGGTSWTTIFTNTIDNSISKDAIKISDVTLPQFQEIKFRIKSTGGAIITGMKFKAEILDKQKY